MKNPLLIPNKYKVIGWILFLIATISFFFFMKFEWYPSMLKHTYIDRIFKKETETNLLKEIIFTFWMLGLMMISFAREKQEDEYISFLRLRSWQYSVLASLVISIIGTWSIYGWDYLMFSALNMLTVPLCFVVIFNFGLYKARKEGVSDEK